MPDLPARFAWIILAFASLSVHPSWRHARVLLIGALPAPGRPTVSSLIRITGRSHEHHLVNYHRALSRARWCPGAGLAFCSAFSSIPSPSGPVVMAVDDTMERRWGRVRLPT